MNPSNSAIMTEDTEDVSLTFGEDEPRKPIRHRLAVLFHLVFRILAIITYIISSFLPFGFIVSFVIIVMFLSMDFWTTKNISGRLLVGLRWWNYVDEDGHSHWVFESRKNQGKTTISSAESRIFWLSLVVTEVLWIIFIFASLVGLRLMWIMVAGIGIILNGANLYGYIRCKMGSGTKITSSAKNFLGQQVIGSMLSLFSKESDNQARPTQN